MLSATEALYARLRGSRMNAPAADDTPAPAAGLFAASLERCDEHHS